MTTLYALVFLVGLLVVIASAYRFIAFLMLYVRGSSIGKYVRPGAYALVTGATDGIGKALALALAERGFNIIAHGRNGEKLTAVKNEIQSLHPGRDVACLIHDGSKGGVLDLSAVRAFPITVLVNNVGVGPMGQFETFSDAAIVDTVTLNAIFPTEVTRWILPQLSKPALILNVSSWAGLHPPPYLAVYAATKAYNNAFSNSLSLELDSVESISLIVGSVNTAANQAPVGFFRPSSAVFARHVLSIVGCGRKSVAPYWPHAVQAYLVSCLPARLLDRTVKKAMQVTVADAAARKTG